MARGSRTRAVSSRPNSSPTDTLATKDWAALLGMLSDPVRLRVLRALATHELAVGEIARALQMPQSTASRHIKPLFDARLAVRRMEGTTSLYRVDHSILTSEVQTLWALTRKRLDGSAQSQDDDARLGVVIASRKMGSPDFFGRIGGEWDSIRKALFGESIGSDAVLGLLDPHAVVGDIGCGTGEISQRIAPYVARVIAIDRESAMIDAAKRRLSSQTNIDFRRGDVMALPLKDRTLDAAVAMLLFHHVDDPAAAVVELARTLKLGGHLLVIDMVEHERAEYRTTMGHRHLGFSHNDAKAWARASGLHLSRWRRVTPGVDVRGPGLFSALFCRRVAGRVR